jgi:hypothetical protein
MTLTDCRHETAILDEIEAGRWPAESPAALREHAASCAVCADVALVAAEIRATDATDAAGAATMALPSAGQVWWRAELRARHEAARLAQRPVVAVQVVAAVVCLLALVTGLRSFAPDAWTWLVQTATMARAGEGAGTWAMGLIVAIGFWVLLAPLAVYMVVRADRQGGR